MDNLILSAEAYLALDHKSDDTSDKAVSAAIIELKRRLEVAKKLLTDNVKDGNTDTQQVSSCYMQC